VLSIWEGDKEFCQRTGAPTWAVNREVAEQIKWNTQGYRLFLSLSVTINPKRQARS
jgi:hypothetical protein